MHPPGSEEFEQTAVDWLLDVVPPDYRLYGVLRKHPVALATMARHHLEAAVQGARQGYRMARTELTDALPPHAIDAVLAAYRREGRRLVAAARGVDAVEEALRGGPGRQRPHRPGSRPGWPGRPGSWPERPGDSGWSPRHPGN
ncbi:MAG TPA: hypothetical protein VKS82_19060 [Streptosporangiaceae bacterium]|nr:hypothetical protein [Streptosporangiaceae bacterium]